MTYISEDIKWRSEQRMQFTQVMWLSQQGGSLGGLLLHGPIARRRGRLRPYLGCGRHLRCRRLRYGTRHRKGGRVRGAVHSKGEGSPRRGGLRRGGGAEEEDQDGGAQEEEQGGSDRGVRSVEEGAGEWGGVGWLRMGPLPLLPTPPSGSAALVAATADHSASSSAIISSTAAIISAHSP